MQDKASGGLSRKNNGLYRRPAAGCHLFQLKTDDERQFVVTVIVISVPSPLFSGQSPGYRRNDVFPEFSGESWEIGLEGKARMNVRTEAFL